ncbi:MAG: hypothetical protein KJ957_08520, partial [Candidatus Omnitrophica bacterium]|nr:hypothetical protein [Candidatus Omnitrophota bacterium]
SSNVQALDGYVESFMKFFRIVDNLKKSIESEDIKKSKSLLEEVRILEEEDNFDFIIKDISNLVDQSNLGLERVKKVVLDLRTFARKSSDEEMELVSVNDVIESALSIVNNEIKYKCELEKDFGELPAIKCHPQKISQVVMNLVMNASQAIQDKGKIRIKTYLKDKYECIDIEDTGSGIPQEKINKIFDPFFTTKDVGKGTGLGLSISYDIVKLHGGDILVESQVGRGTKMTIVLPLIQKGSENSKQPSEPSS